MSTAALSDTLRDRYALSPAEAAHALGVSRQTIYNLIERGQLTSTTIGRSRRIPRSEVLRLAGEAPSAAA